MVGGLLSIVFFLHNITISCALSGWYVLKVHIFVLLDFNSGVIIRDPM